PGRDRAVLPGVGVARADRQLGRAAQRGAQYQCRGALPLAAAAGAAGARDGAGLQFPGRRAARRGRSLSMRRFGMARWLLLLLLIATPAAAESWIGSWGAAPQPAIPAALEVFHDETLRLIVHVSAGGKTLRVRLSNLYGDTPLRIGAAHVARRIV